jgi:plasmid stability protein
MWNGSARGWSAICEAEWPFGIFAINAYIYINAIRGVLMASITIRNLEEPLKARLRIRAATHGRSMEEEARDILRNALHREPGRPANLVASIRARFAPLGGVELPEAQREPMRKPPHFGR